MSQVDSIKNYNTRSKVGYSPYPNYGMKYKNSFFPYMTKLWNDLEVGTQVLPLKDFKDKLKQ